MQVVMIYSGKGGVGKTTTTINIARTLEAKGKSIYILDGDINTPSIHTILGTSQQFSKKIRFNSTGIIFKDDIYLQKSQIRKYVNETIKDINNYNPDVVLVDTPPSITDVHLNLIERLKISAIIMVTQPTTLSIEDVRRTRIFFNNKGIITLGIIQNMVSKELGQRINTEIIGLKTLAVVPLNKKYNDINILKSNLKVYDTAIEYILKSEEVALKEKKNMVHKDPITLEDLKKHIERNGELMIKKEDLYFRNIETWDYISEKLQDLEERVGYQFGRDRLYEWNTTERIKKVLDAFESDKEIYVMISKPPIVKPFIICGEIGPATLNSETKGMFHRIPTVYYKTQDGPVTLFPHEVIPLSNEEIAEYISEGYRIISDERYIPTKEHIKMLLNTFGSNLIQMNDDWEEKYDKYYS